MVSKEVISKKETVYRTVLRKPELQEVLKDVLESYQSGKKVVLSVKVL